MSSSLPGRPAGVRERQKKHRERRILAAAHRLFARKGYSETGMEAVAASAGLAVGTIYNYFPSKNDLLLAIVRRETEHVLEAGKRIVANPPEDPAEAIAALAGVFLDGFADGDRRLWRELMSAAIAAPDTIGARLFESDALLISQMAALLDSLKSRGRLRANLDAAGAAMTLYSVCFTWVMAYLMNDGVANDAMRRQIRHGVEIVTIGLLP